MEGVTTAIVGFILVCIIFPQLIKNRAQYYAAFAAVLLGILIWSLGHVVGNATFWNFVRALHALLDVAALVLLMLAAGGLHLRDLTGDITRAFEVIRRGETEKTVVIPLTPAQKARAAAMREVEEDERRERIEIAEATGGGGGGGLGGPAAGTVPPAGPPPAEPPPPPPGRPEGKGPSSPGAIPLE